MSVRASAGAIAAAGVMAAGLVGISSGTAQAAPSRGAQSQAASGCAVLVGSHTSGNNNIATVRNQCGYTISARPTVNFFPDPNCTTIPAYQSRDFRVGGSASPRASGAVVC